MQYYNMMLLYMLIKLENYIYIYIAICIMYFFIIFIFAMTLYYINQSINNHV